MTNHPVFRFDFKHGAPGVLLCVTFLLVSFPAFGGDIAGTVREEGSGAPIENIDIDVFDSSLLSVATTARSDASGQYLVSGLAAGNYIIRADPSVIDPYVDQYNGGAFLRSQAPFVTVPGVGTVTVNFSLIQGAPIFGRVTIQGSGGSAAVGVDIDVFTDTGELVDSVNATTDANGLYTIGSFPLGSYLLRADPDPSTFLIERFYLNGESRNEATSILVIGTAPVTGIDIELPQGGLIRGIVRDGTTSNPVANVDLDVFDSLGAFQRANASTVTSGTYELGPLIPGQYYVRADPLPTTYYVGTYHPNSLLESGGSLVQVGVGAIVENVDIEMSRGGNISGIVRSSGTLQPAPEIDIDVFDALGARMPVNTKTDLAGAYLIGALPPGQYRIRTDPTLLQGFAGEYYADAILEASGSLVAVNANMTTTPIDFDLEQGAIVEGIVTGADTLMGLVGIDLDLFTSQGDLYAGADAVSSATGYYRLGPIPPGTWILQADPTVAQGYVDEYFQGELALSRATTLILGAGELRDGIDLELDRGGLIAGTVRLRSNNQPLAGCDLDVFFTDHRRVDDAALTDDNGDYVLGLLPPGQYLVRADPPQITGLAERYYDDVADVTQAQPITVEVDQTTSPIDFFLDPEIGATDTATPTPLATPTPTSASATLTPSVTPIDTFTGTSTPTPTDSFVGTPTPTPSESSEIPFADLDGDLRVSAPDLLELLRQWRMTTIDPLHPADFDGSGKVDPPDLEILALQWATERVP